MSLLKNYLNDGADPQAKAVLAMLQDDPNIKESWNNEASEYEVEIKVGRWENGREQGYVVYLRVQGKQLNIAFFEHRNSDNISAVMWEQFSMNSINHASADFGDVYQDKFDTSFNVGWGQFQEMADWIMLQMRDFYTKNKEK